MSAEKKEVAVIDFTKFDIAQLPELKGKKKEIANLIKANPIVEVTDNSSYELAKKSRTAVKTLRTSLEKEKKDVNDRIKKNVLEVVANEYDSLIESVKSDENARQKPVTDWEEKKEQERLEKARLEQERIDGIKKSIGEFREFWEDKVSSITFETIEDISDLYSVAVVEFDRDSLAEFDVLFTDAVNYIDKMLESRIKTLEEQEEIRITQIELAKEKERQEAEAKKIAEEQKRVAEEQRIAQEKFLAEKKEFEEKQAEAKLQSRIKQLTDLGIHEDVIWFELGGNKNWANLKHSAINEPDDVWNKTLIWAKEQIEIRDKVIERPINEMDVIAEELKSDESANNQGLSTRLKAGNSTSEKTAFDSYEIPLTWESIIQGFKNTKDFTHEDLGVDVLYNLELHLSRLYNVPTFKAKSNEQ